MWSALSSPLSSGLALLPCHAPAVPTRLLDVARDYRRSCTLGLCGIPSTAQLTTRHPGGSPRRNRCVCRPAMPPGCRRGSARGEGPENSQVGPPRGHAESEDGSVLLVTVRPAVGVTRRPAIRSVVAAEASPLPTGRPGSGLIPRSGRRGAPTTRRPRRCPDAALQWHQTRPHPAPLSGAQKNHPAEHPPPH